MFLRLLPYLCLLLNPICSAQSSYFQSIIDSPSLRHEAALFFDEVLRQGSSDAFFAQIDQYNADGTKRTDAEWYELLYANRKTLQPKFPLIDRYKTLRYQQALLGKQIATLLPQGRTWDGILEIGTPGTYIAALHNTTSLTGKRFVVCDQKGPATYIQAWTGQFSRLGVSYDVQFPLADYAPLDSTIPDASLDLVICVIGLHHIPADKIEPFVTSIARVLRPGGVFILRDHNCTDTDSYTLAHGAHFMFNLLIGDVDPQGEQEELRNFQPLEHWTTLLANHGFSVNPVQLVQKNDTTRNTLIACTKNATDTATSRDQAEHELTMTGGARAGFQTYMTTSEWISVELAEQEAKYGIAQWHQFPYAQSIGLLWSSFHHSWKQARLEHSLSAVLLSDYTLMNLFICSMTSLQYLLRSGTFTLLHYAAPHTDGLVHRTIDDTYKAYSAWIYHTPFYAFAHWKALKNMWTAYAHDLKNRSALNKLNDSAWAVTQSFEYILNGSISALMGCIYSAEQSTTERLQIIVKDPEDYVMRTHSQTVHLLGSYPDGLKRLAVPRYIPFQQLLQDLARHQIQIVSIAGNSVIQCKVRYANNIQPHCNDNSCIRTFTWQLPGDTEHTYANYTVRVTQLHQVLTAFEQQGVELVYCHDF